ncbi:MAG: DUF1080 domain-containing protein [Planctomycetaceae bacterium]|nr:DUF1080 domain-containing protein [Planctomycetaceae bacterium]
MVPARSSFTMAALLISWCQLCLDGSNALAQGYTNLISDASLSQWTKADGKPVDGGWVLEPGGVLHLSGKGGNLISRDEFGDFDLWFEYRISEKGNNGIKYRVKKYGNSLLGLEYQIQDDQAFPKMAEKHRTASLYDLFVPSQPFYVRDYKPLSDYNVGRIVVQNGRVRHWMNGRLIIDEYFGTPRWMEAVANSKFRNHEGFGQNTVGRLMLTDHNSEVWLRNVFIRRLDGCSQI